MALGGGHGQGMSTGPFTCAPTPGEYIYALRDLTFATFCGAVSEKFCDLSWEERLLKSLFQVVNGRASPPTG